jgi:hypothetical protein
MKQLKRWIGGANRINNRKKRNQHTVVYLVSAGFQNGKYPIKIGVTRSLERRLSNLQTGNPHKISLLAQLLVPSDIAYQVESEVHRRLDRYLIRGEWYLLEREQVDQLTKWFHSHQNSDFTAYFDMRG